MEQGDLIITIAATFTADPVAASIERLLGLFHVSCRVELAAYDQLLQELIDGSGAFARNRDGVNVALVRLADLGLRGGQRGRAPNVEAMRAGAREVAHHVSGHCQREGAAPLLLCICPEPKRLLENAAHAALTAELEASLAAEADARGAAVVTSADLRAIYPVDLRDDPAADDLGHIPYTPELFAALGALIARKIRARLAPPFKVLALDADNTLWTGVAGEDGPEGVVIDEGRVALQRFARAQHDAGMLLCLCSKNVAEDVEEVFRRRAMPLERRHITAARVSWQPKSRSLRELAAELSLGLDAFVFADDSLVECAEVRAHCPEVLTIHLPEDGAQAAALLQHVWAFDRWKVTGEDRRRPELYRRAAEREESRRAAPSMAEFLASLALEIHIGPPDPADMARISQLTFRTNQLNFTTRRRSEPEIRDTGLSCLKVHVRDRFGDHGLVGVMLFGPSGGALAVDTFLLSCRVLQRGVEHAMLARLGRIATESGLAHVEVPLTLTAKNLPAQQFLRSVGARWIEEHEGGFVARIPAGEARALAHRPGAAAAEETKPESLGARAILPGQNAVIESVARELGSASAILARVAPKAAAKPRPALSTAAVAPRTGAERVLSAICEEALGVAPIGVTDDLFLQLGADSFTAVRIAAALRALGRDVRVETVQEARTVERLAAMGQGARASGAAVTAGGRTPPIHALRRGGTKRPLFLGRPATRSGGALAYVALARHIDPDRPVYVFQNRPLLDATEPYASVEDMAAEYLAAMREAQSEGPYLLAGWCLGGKIAFEMANRLTASGQRVDQLVLFDTAAPGGLRDRAELVVKHELIRAELRAFARYPWLSRVFPSVRVARSRSMLRRFGVLAYFEPDSDDVRLIEYAFPGRFEQRALSAMTPEARWSHVYEELAADERAGSDGDGVDAASVRRGFKYFARDHRLDALYAPKWVYPGATAMLTVRGGAARAAGWTRFLARRPAIHELDVTGNESAPDPHSAMMSEENVKLMAGDLNRMLGRS